MSRIRWGLLGAGRISGWFATGLSVLPDDAELYAIASRDLNKAQAFAEKFHVTTAYGDYESMIRDPNVDIIYVGTPIACHYENVRQCLLGGKNVLCEKAFTVNAAQARELQELAQARGLFLMEGMWTKCQPVFRTIHQWVKDGVLGEIQAVSCNFFTKTGAGHRLYKHELAGGALLDLGVYPVMYACSLLGYKPEEIRSSAAILAPKRVDCMDSIQLLYPGGRYANITCGLGCDKSHSLYIQGTKGRIYLNAESFVEAQHVTAYDFENQVLASFEEPFRANGFEYEAAAVMQALRDGKTGTDLVPMDETIAVLDILDACRRQWNFRFDCEGSQMPQ